MDVTKSSLKIKTSLSALEQVKADPQLSLSGSSEAVASTKASGASLQITSFSDWVKLSNQTAIIHSDAYRSANSAVATMDAEVGKIQKQLNISKPRIKDADWDFVMKDGKFEVAGGVSSKDKKYIENLLNGDKALTAAVVNFNAAAVLNLETSKDNPSYNYLNAFEGRMENRTFYNVADQMNGSVKYKSLLQSTKTYRAIGQSERPADATANIAQMGAGTLDVLSSQLKSSNQKINYEGFTLDPIEGTLGRT